MSNQKGEINMINITEKDLEKLKKIGEGQFGKVYQADEKTAYKIYFKEIKHTTKGIIKNPALIQPIHRLKKLKKHGRMVKNTDMFIDYVYIDGMDNYFLIFFFSHQFL